MVTEPGRPEHHEHTVYADFDSKPDLPAHSGESPTDFKATTDRPPGVPEISFGTDRHLAGSRPYRSTTTSTSLRRYRRVWRGLT